MTFRGEQFNQKLERAAAWLETKLIYNYAEKKKRMWYHFLYSVVKKTDKNVN